MDLLGWTTLIYKKLELWIKTIISMLPNIGVAILIIIAAFFISKFIRNFSTKIVQRLSKSDSVSGLVGLILQVLVLFFAMTIALNVLNLDKAVSSLLAGIGIVGLALGFAFQDLSSNFISGVYMAFKKPFEIGDKVETNGFIGTVEEVQLRSTTLFTTAGLYVIIPNKDIFQKPIINYSRSSNRRVELDFTLPNTLELSFAESLIRKALEELTSNQPVSDISVYFISIDDPKVKLHVSFHIDNSQPKGFMTTRHQAIKAIFKAFNQNNVVKIAALNPPEQVTA